MAIIDWLIQNSTPLKDLGLLIFAGVGAFFTYRAWWQRNLEIKEKFYDRRFKVFEMVNEAVSLGLRPGNTDWMPKIVEARRRAEFLFGPDVNEPLSIVQRNLEEYLEASAHSWSSDLAAKIKESRKNVDEAYKNFSASMHRYISVSRDGSRWARR